MQMEGNWNKDYWTEKYLLGLVSEIDEVLDEIRWKRHRRKEVAIRRRDNVGLQLADIFKYTMCLFQLWGFYPEDMLDFAAKKGDMLEFKLSMEFSKPLPPKTKIAIIDMDGVVVDLNKSFAKWASEEKGLEINTDSIYKSTKQDELVNLHYSEYTKLKDEFESSGGYRVAEPYPDAIEFLQRLKSCYIHTIIVTDRPMSKETRIFFDTWSWLTANEIPFNEIYIQDYDRILLAENLIKKGHDVVLFEDNSEIAKRAFRSGVPTFIRAQPYNNDSPLTLTRFEKFTNLTIENIWRSDV